MSEEEEIEKAIQLSLFEPPKEKSKIKKYSMVDYRKYLTEENSTKIQFRLPNGKKEIHKVNVDAPLIVLYAIFFDLLGKEVKPFKVVYQPSKTSVTLEDSSETTIKDLKISNTSLSIIFD
jgi:hypothetical protein